MVYVGILHRPRCLLKQQTIRREGNPVVQTATKTWRTACTSVRLKLPRWHVQSGTPLHVLQKLGDWECVDMVRRYTHLSSAHLVGYVYRLSRLKAGESPAGAVVTF